MLTKQLVCFRHGVRVWEYNSESNKDPRPQGAYILYIKCIVSQLVRRVMEEKYIMGVPGGVRAPMSLGKVTFEQKPVGGKEQVKCSQ